MSSSIAGSLNVLHSGEGREYGNWRHPSDQGFCFNLCNCSYLIHSFAGVLDGTAATLVGETESCHLVASSSGSGGRSVGSFAGALVIFDSEFEIVGVTSNGFWGVAASFSIDAVGAGKDHVTGSEGQNKNAVTRVRTTAAPAILRLCCARLMIADHSREELLEKNRGELESGEVSLGVNPTL